jgi:hypothetical protein
MSIESRLAALEKRVETVENVLRPTYAWIAYEQWDFEAQEPKPGVIVGDGIHTYKLYIGSDGSDGPKFTGPDDWDEPDPKGNES